MKMWIVLWKILGICVWTCWAYQGSTKHYTKWREQLPFKTTTESAIVASENDIYDNLKFRHSSRFPHLDKVLHKLRHQERTTTTTTTDEGLFEDDYYDNEYVEDTDNLKTDVDLNEYGFYSNNDPVTDDWQAEEATEPPPRPTTSIRPIQQHILSPMGQFKWDNYGTVAKVEQSRREHLQYKSTLEQKRQQFAVAHYMKINKEGQCSKPLPKIISVQAEHPDPTKTYTPHCTILHRCSEDTGCCSIYNTKCGPKTQNAVELYFYVKTVGTSDTKVIWLTFDNHTECHCVSNTESTTNSKENSVDELVPFAKSAAKPENITRCKCPQQFIAKMSYNAECICDCEAKNEVCTKMKKGKEHFSLTERKCITESRCVAPSCEYGAYRKAAGRCPLKEEKLNNYD